VAAGARGWLVVAWLGVVATGVSYLLFGSALRFISAATGVALALGEPLTAFTLAVLVLGEPLRASGLVGIAAILAGLALVIAAEL
jgi:DME family drug/metabolite transporter